MKKYLVILMILVMTLAFVGCGGKTDKKAETTLSENGAVTITLADGYKGTPTETYKGQLMIQPDKAKDSNTDFIEIEGPGEEGIHQNFQFYVYADSTYKYREDAAYTMEMLKSDIDTYIAEYPNIYSNAKKVTIGDYDYIRCDCVTNAEDAHYYYTVVNEKPFTVGVVGGDLLDINSDDVKTMMESLVFKYEK